MIILSENNFKPLEKVPHVEDPENVPDVVFYPEIFDKPAIKKMVNILDSMAFGINDCIWLSDHPDITYNSRISAVPFPYFIVKYYPQGIEKIKKQNQSFGAKMKIIKRLEETKKERIEYLKKINLKESGIIKKIASDWGVHYSTVSAFIKTHYIG